MKRKLLQAPLLSLLFAVQPVFAQETFFGTLDADVVFNNGVLLQGVTNTSDSAASIKLEGSGTLTVSSAAGGGFPRIVVYGGTDVSSARSFSTDEVNRSTWAGQFGAPSSSVKPGFFDINAPSASFASDYETTEAFGLGLANEEFTFSPAATFVFPTGERNGQKLYVAHQQSDESWDIAETTFCVVQDGLCAVDLGSINKIALIKEVFETCPVQNITNGSVGSIPSCIYTCNKGFGLTDDGRGCEASVSNEDFENSFNETVTEAAFETTTMSADNEWVLPTRKYDFPQGHFRYRASGSSADRYLDEGGLENSLTNDKRYEPYLSGDRRQYKREESKNGVIKNYSDLGLAKHVNTSYLSRNPRSAEEQLAARNEGGSTQKNAADDESFVSYLIQMRNHFGKNAAENHFTAMSAEGGTSGGEAAAEAGEAVMTGEIDNDNTEEGQFLSSGPLLPSTGPGLFVTIAVVGFALMMFGARRS